MVVRFQARACAQRRPALGIFIGLRRDGLAAIDLELEIVRSEPVAFAHLIIDLDLSVKIVQIEGHALGIVLGRRVVKAVEAHGIELLRLHRGDRRERHVDIVAVENGVELTVGILVGHFDARRERLVLRDVLVDKFNNIVGTERPGEADLLCLVAIVLRARDSARGIHDPVVPVRGICGNIARIVIGEGKQIVVGLRRIVGNGAVIVPCALFAVVRGEHFAVQTAQKPALSVCVDAVVADAVEQDPAVVTHDDGHAALVGLRLAVRRRARIELAQGDTDIREVIRLRTGRGVRRARDRDGRTLAELAHRHGVYRRVGIPLRNGAEGAQLRQIAVLRVVRRRPVVECAVIEHFGLTVGKRLRGADCGTALLFAGRDPLIVRRAECVLDTDRKRRADGDVPGIVDIALRFGRYRRRVDAVLAPGHAAEIVIALGAVDLNHRAARKRADPEACDRLVERVRIRVSHCLGICQRDGVITDKLCARKLIARRFTGTTRFIRRLAREQTQRQQHRK